MVQPNCVKHVSTYHYVDGQTKLWQP